MQDAWIEQGRGATGRRIPASSVVRIGATGLSVALLWFAALVALGLPLAVGVIVGVFALTVSTLALAVARAGAVARQRRDHEGWYAPAGD